MRQNRKVNEKAFTPKSLLKAFKSYIEWVEANPIKKTDFVGGAGKLVTRELPRPLTMEGFEIFIFNNGGIRDISPYFANRGQRYTDFIEVCNMIKTTIRANQIEGGMCGLFHHNITARLNGLVDKAETKSSGVVEVRMIREELTPELQSKNRVPFWGPDGKSGYYEIEGDAKGVPELPLFED